MKKILHLFSDPSHSALWSRYLRMLTLIALFAFGSHGVWGEETATPKESWTPEDKKLTGDVFTGNNMSINLAGTWQYVSELSAIKKGASATYPDKKDDVSESELNTYLSGKSYIKIAAKATGTIKVTGLYGNGNYKIVVGRTEYDGSVKFFEDPIQSFTYGISTKFEFMVFGGRNYYVFVPEGVEPKLGDAIFQGIEFFAAHGNNVTLANEVKNGKVTLEVAYPYIANTTITQGNKAQCVDGYDITIKPQPADGYVYRCTKVSADDASVAEKYFYFSLVIKKDNLKEFDGKDITFTPEFVKGIKVSALAEVGGTAKYSLNNSDQENESLQKPDQNFVFTAASYKGYTFSGWYDGSNFVSLDNPYTARSVTTDLTLTAKFECNIKNNTQKVDLSKYYEPGGNVDKTATKWDDKNKTLSVTTKGQWDNVLYLTKINNENRGTGIRIHASGKPYRVIVRFNEKFENETKSLTKDIKIDESTEENDYHTHHYSWKKFGLTDAQISQITDVGVAGLNTTTDETKYTFYVKYFWIDDIADYDHTIACYGEEKGEYNWGSQVYTYSHTNDGVKAAFSNISGDDRNNDTYSIKFKTGDRNKLNISSSNYNFSSIGLIFDSSVEYNLSIGGTKVSGNAVSVLVPVNGSPIDIINNGTEALSLAKITYTGKATGINKMCTIDVDGKERKYWIYAPGKVDGQKNVPVIFSLHGRQDKGADPSKTDAPKFNSIADSEGVIIVYPQGRHATDTGYPNRTENGKEVAWNSGYAGNNYGWEATGQENADTKFIQALVDELKKNKFYNNTTVDPKRFYLCGFSMGGMMTYACAKVLNGTFAAYGSCGGFPLNEFHLNLATKQPVPFMHLHGDADGIVGINHLHTIIENLLFRNGCDLSKQDINKDWSTTNGNGETHHFKRYDFKGVNEVPVTTVTFDGLDHAVEASAPVYLWNFFSDKTVGQYDSDIEWKWDMPTINANIAANSSNGNVNAYTYGWKHVINGTDRSLTYGGGGKTQCSSEKCTSANNDCNGNHNVYNSIQLTPGKHTLYAQMTSTSGVSSVTLRNILTGAETVARKVVDNSGTHDPTNFNVLYEFEVGEGAEFSLELKRSETNSACTKLEIHKGSYRPDGVKDASQDNATVHLDYGKLAELTFENGNNGVDIYPTTEKYIQDGKEKYNVANESDNKNMKLYLISRLGIKNGNIDNEAKYIVKDAVFGHYFQNIPDADIYDRYGASDYMRVVLGEKNSLSGHDGIKGIQETGAVTIGFWVNGDLAVNRGLAYDEPSMFYIAGNTYIGPNPDQNNGIYNPHMFNITCSGGLTGYMKVNDTTFDYNSGTGSFGQLCDTKSNADFYNKNFYKDCNWHYITYQMYDNLSRYNMYVDGEPTCLGGYATHNARSLNDCISGLKSIVLGGANANNVTFAYDVAFAYDDIVIYNRVLSKREINKIVENKKYSPSVWNFDRNLESDIFFNKDNLNNTMWTSSDGVYTLNTNFTQAAALTYDGITEIPAFKGLRFVTNGGQKIKIDAKSGALHLSKGVKVVFSNLVKDTYVRMEYKKKENNVAWTYEDLQNVPVFGELPSPSQDCVKTYFKVGDATSGESSITITMPSDIDIIRMEATAKSFAQIKFVDQTVPQNVISEVKNPANNNALPRLDLYINAVERLHKQDPETYHKFIYTSSSPHVASIDSEGNVTLHGIAGSTVITAELVNDENKYDCDIYDQYAFEPSNRIFSSYEIVVDPKEGTFYKVADGKTYTVGQTLYNGNGTVGVTLGGWTYNGGTYYDKYTDLYTAKEPWAGHKFEKNADRNGYLANSRKTEENVFHEFFDDKATFSTNGSHAAKSEQLKVDDNHTYAATGNYSAPADNKSAANATPWLLPCRGSHIKIEPTDAGLISVYVMQEGCVSHVPSGETMIVGGDTYQQDEPIDVTVKRVYVADEKGEIVKEVVADTKSKVAAQMWKDDGRARAEYFWDDPEFAYNEATMKSFLKINDFNTQWSFLDNWPNPGMQQHVFKVGKDEDGKDKDGYVLITKGIVRYTFNVLPGKTYYIFSNTAKLGLAGFTFEQGRHAEYDMVQVDAKHKECRATGDFVNVSKDPDITLEDDGTDYSARTEKNVDVTLNRTFYKNYWNAICLPYSINRRQIEKVFGDGTMIVLMDNINTSTKKVMFIEHANQDIIAGYPYLIFPTTKADTEKTDHSAINGITTRATFGEANSPLFSVGTDGNTYPFAEPMQSDALVFKGTFTNTTLNEGSYVVTNKGVLSRIPKDEMNIKSYRSYIYFNRENAGAKAILLQDMNVNGFENDEDHTTGIENLLFESGILTHSADVYSIDGQLVRSKALNFNGLPKGVYIVNGKKYVKK